VISYVATAVALEYLHARLRELILRGEHVRAFRIATECNDRWVLEQQQRVRDLVGFAQLHQRLLQLERASVIDAAELDDRDHTLT